MTDVLGVRVILCSKDKQNFPLAACTQAVTLTQKAAPVSVSWEEEM